MKHRYTLEQVFQCCLRMRFGEVQSYSLRQSLSLAEQTGLIVEVAKRRHDGLCVAVRNHHAAELVISCIPIMRPCGSVAKSKPLSPAASVKFWELLEG
jgi:hypothetical protein